MTFLDCFKQQIFLFLMCAIAVCAGYCISLFLELRNPHQLSTEYVIAFAVTFIASGTLLRFFFQKK